MHYLANLTTFNYQGCLYALAHANQIVVNSRNSKERGNESLTPDPSPTGEGSG